MKVIAICIRKIVGHYCQNYDYSNNLLLIRLNQCII